MLPFQITTNQPTYRQRDHQTGGDLPLRFGRRQQHPLGFRHRALMLPTAYRRYLRSQGRRGRGYVEPLDDDRLEIVLQPDQLDPDATPQAIQTIALQVLREEYGIVPDAPIRVSVFTEIVLRRTAVNEPVDEETFFTLGGEAETEVHLERLADWNLSETVDVFTERGYRGIDLAAFQFTFAFHLVDVLRQLAGGGCPDQFPHPLGAETGFAFHQYDRLTHGEKVTFGRRYKAQTPTHLAGVRGLWGMTDQTLAESWRISHLCGITAFLYGWEEAKRRRGETHCVEVYATQPEELYMAAATLVQEKEYPLPVMNCLLRYMVEDMCPDHAVFVFDKGMMPLYFHKGSQYVDQATHPIQRGELTADNWASFWDFRIVMFLDLEKMHYFAVFNLPLFFRPVGPVTKRRAVSSSTTATNTSEMRPPCPFCHHRVGPSNMLHHQCKTTVCRFCHYQYLSFEDMENHHKIAHGKKKCKECPTCLETMANSLCFNKHVTLCTSMSTEQCGYCHLRYRTDEIHHCPRYLCTRCQQVVMDPILLDPDNDFEPYRQLHRCPMRRSRVTTLESEVEQPASASAGRGVSGVGMRCFAFDLESMLVRLEQPLRMAMREIPVYRHVVNYAYALELVDDPRETAPLEIETTTLAELWADMVSATSKASTVWYAHNLKGYDGRLLLDYLEEQGIVPDTLLMRGTKIMMMTVPHPEGKHKLHFKDSLLHIAAPLSALPAMFGLDTTLVKKGFFPYLFNTPERQQYRGAVPAQSFYEPEKMSTKARLEFTEWYRTQRRRVFSLQKELAAYCKNDVLILQQGLMAYAKVCVEYGGRHPLLDMTIAQFTFNVYKERDMPDNTLFYLDNSHSHFARRALHGGKTDVRRLRYVQTPEDQAAGRGLRYIDIQSLYPTVQYYDPMPTGYPTTTRYEPDQQPSPEVLASFFGFIECDIEPVAYLHHPLLSTYRGHHLLADLLPQKRCVLTSVEFHEAVQPQRYRCTQVYRIDHYQPSTDLFQSFVRRWLKLKTISSKMPVPEDQFDSYQASLYQRLGIRVERSEFVHNVSLRTLAKMILNSLWGKFGQRDGLVKCDILKASPDVVRFYNRKRQGLLKEKSSRWFGGVFPMKHYVSLWGHSNKNVAVAAFVTAHARLRLWKVLHQLGPRVYYHDTDSVIYAYDPQLPNIEEGIFLGDWESETKGALIHRFVGLAPKTYAYAYREEDTGEEKRVVKAKGFTLKSQEAEQAFTLDSFEAVLLQQQATLSIQQHIFQRIVAPTPMMVTYHAPKAMSFKYEKGLLSRNTLMTFPYGSERFLSPEVLRQIGDLPSTTQGSCSSIPVVLDDEEE